MYIYIFVAVLMILICSGFASAQESHVLVEQLRALKLSQQNLEVSVDTIWVFFAGILVFLMNVGFTLLEAGSCRPQSFTSFLAKKITLFCLISVTFWIFGFGLMFGDGSDWVGSSGFLLLSPAENSPTIGDNYKGVFDSLNWASIPLHAKFFFQLTFTGVVASIVSTIVAERIETTALLLFIFLLVGLSYAVTGHWAWGGGWLEKLGFWDFAGSTIVHSVSGWAGLIGTLFLGPRSGKYTDVSVQEYQNLPFISKTIIFNRNSKNQYQKINILPATTNNLLLTTVSCFILWLGWFGLNAGSTLDANASAIAHILVNTLMAGALGGIGAVIGSFLYFSKPSLMYIVNGILGGCVGISASCAFVDISSAAIIGFCSGLIVIFASVFAEKLKIDDPVSSIPVHLFCGIWGTLAVALFSEGTQLYPQYGLKFGPTQGLFMGGGLEVLWIQIIGIISIGFFTVLFSILSLTFIQIFLGKSLRISTEKELNNLKINQI